MKKPMWLAYAELIKAKLAQLPASNHQAESRQIIISESHATAQKEHSYPGSVADWDYVVANAKINDPVP